MNTISYNSQMWYLVDDILKELCLTKKDMYLTVDSIDQEIFNDKLYVNKRGYYMLKARKAIKGKYDNQINIASSSINQHFNKKTIKEV